MLVKCSVARILYYPYKFPSGKFLSFLKRENRHARISRLPSGVVRTPFRPILDVTLLPSPRASWSPRTSVSFFLSSLRWKTSSQLRNANVQRHGSVLHFKLSPRGILPSGRANTVERVGEDEGARGRTGGGNEARRKALHQAIPASGAPWNFEAVNSDSRVPSSGWWLPPLRCSISDSISAIDEHCFTLQPRHVPRYKLTATRGEEWNRSRK